MLSVHMQNCRLIPAYLLVAEFRLSYPSSSVGEGGRDARVNFISSAYDETSYILFTYTLIAFYLLLRE